MVTVTEILENEEFGYGPSLECYQPSQLIRAYYRTGQLDEADWPIARRILSDVGDEDVSDVVEYAGTTRMEVLEVQALLKIAPKEMQQLVGEYMIGFTCRDPDLAVGETQERQVAVLWSWRDRNGVKPMLDADLLLIAYLTARLELS